MAVSVENLIHGAIPENNCTNTLSTRDNLPLQACEGRPQELDTHLSPSNTQLFMLAQTTAGKRRRPAHDVDGPHTEFLGCKKRRLRRDLITSRLSRPYSMPATHIINREAAAGDKRFLKLAAVARSKKLNAVVVPTPEDYGARMPTTRPGPVVPMVKAGPIIHGSSEIVRRAAILNRIRLKVRDERRGSIEISPREGMAFPVVGSGETANTVPLKAVIPPNLPEGNPTLPTPAASSSDVLHLGRISPQLKPLRSPELRAFRAQITKPMDDDQLDDDSLSFPHSMYSEDGVGCGEDDDDVYADFSIIFGGTDEDGGPGTEIHGGEHFENYMDDLDGIPREVR